MFIAKKDPNVWKAFSQKVFSQIAGQEDIRKVISQSIFKIFAYLWMILASWVTKIIVYSVAEMFSRY